MHINAFDWKNTLEFAKKYKKIPVFDFVKNGLCVKSKKISIKGYRKLTRIIFLYYFLNFYLMKKITNNLLFLGFSLKKWHFYQKKSSTRYLNKFDFILHTCYGFLIKKIFQIRPCILDYKFTIKSRKKSQFLLEPDLKILKNKPIFPQNE
jgi:hypothetical protein